MALRRARSGARLADYRAYHLKHHRYTEQPEDPDLVALRAVSDLAREPRAQDRPRPHGPDLPEAAARALLLAALRKNGPSPARRSAFAFLIVNAILFAGLAIAGYWWAYPALWLVPMATWFPLVTRLRNIAEHACVDTKEDPFSHARTTKANILERLFIAPYWVHFHGEHHVFMHVPCYHLGAACTACWERRATPRA